MSDGQSGGPKENRSEHKKTEKNLLECYRNPPGALEHTPKKWFECGAKLGMERWSAKKEVKSWSATRTLVL